MSSGLVVIRYLLLPHDWAISASSIQSIFPGVITWSAHGSFVQKHASPRAPRPSWPWNILSATWNVPSIVPSFSRIEPKLKFGAFRGSRRSTEGNIGYPLHCAVKPPRPRLQAFRWPDLPFSRSIRLRRSDGGTSELKRMLAGRVCMESSHHDHRFTILFTFGLLISGSWVCCCPPWLSLRTLAAVLSVALSKILNIGEIHDASLESLSTYCNG